MVGRVGALNLLWIVTVKSNNLHQNGANEECLKISSEQIMSVKPSSGLYDVALRFGTPEVPLGIFGVFKTFSSNSRVVGSASADFFSKTNK